MLSDRGSASSAYNIVRQQPEAHTVIGGAASTRELMDLLPYTPQGAAATFWPILRDEFHPPRRELFWTAHVRVGNEKQSTGICGVMDRKRAHQGPLSDSFGHLAQLRSWDQGAEIDFRTVTCDTTLGPSVR